MEKSKLPSLTDVPVFLMIFVRPEQLKESFTAIKKARPSKLFIVSDGPRTSHPNDSILNNKCKEIVLEIDWECEVHHKYSEVNQGMYVTCYEGLKWAFDQVDRLIFLEDDIVPNQSFFPFCEELLEKYKNDSRIHSICGMNHVGVYESPSADYFFARAGSIWGFAIWKRTFDTFEYDLNFTQDKYSFDLLINSYEKTYRKEIKNAIISKRKRWEENMEKGDFELISSASFFLNNRLMIIPSRNMICCRGISENSGHNTNHPLKLPKSIRRLFDMKTHELKWPLKHPKYIITDTNYEKLVLKCMGKNKSIRLFRKIEYIMRRLFYGILLRK
jgi:hypothetical protein